MRLVGIVLVLLGAVALGYQGFTYVALEAAGDVTPIRPAATWLPPVVGGIATVTGLLLLAAGGRRGA